MTPARVVREMLGEVLVVVFVAAPANGQATTVRMSVRSNGTQGALDANGAAISGDGHVAIFSTKSKFVQNDANGKQDVYVRDWTLNTIERVSVDSSGGDGNNDSGGAAISANGQVVAFESAASNLVAGDTNGWSDVFIRDRVTGLTERISLDSGGGQGKGASAGPSLSSDGQIVAFQSEAANLVSGDTNGKRDVFVHDRSTGITERISVDSSGVEGNDFSEGASISADGRFVVFTSWASNLVANDTNGGDVFVHDRVAGTTERVSVDSSGAQGNGDSLLASISADGTIVAFESSASTLVSGDTNRLADVFAHDRSNGITERVSVDSSGNQGTGSGGYTRTSVSGDGRFVSFSTEDSLLVSGDTNSSWDAFVRDRLLGVTTRVSVDSSGAEGHASSYDPVVSSDGTLVTFSSNASNLVAGDTNAAMDVFLRGVLVDAVWSNYGSGFPGTNGIPTFTALADPVIGTTLTLNLANSIGSATIGLLFVGFQQTSIPSSWGGDLLVVPLITELIPISASGEWLTGAIPLDDTLCGVSIDLQAIEVDSGAARGVSFTPGLSLVLGH